MSQLNGVTHVNGYQATDARDFDLAAELAVPISFSLPTFVSDDPDEFGWQLFDHLIEVRFRDVKKTRGDAHAVVDVNRIHADGSFQANLWWGDLSLRSSEARHRAQLMLERAVTATVPWEPVMRWCCRHAEEFTQQGEPLVNLKDVEVDEAMHYTLSRVLPAGEPTLLYADGGAGKSTIASAIAVALATGHSLPGGLRPLERGPTLYLDWETHEKEAARRLRWIARGWGLELPDFFYRRMHATLAEDIRDVARIVRDVKPVLVVVDSAIMACGGDPKEAEPATALYNALRRLDVTSLVLSHVAKEGNDDPRKAKSSYGTVFFKNWSRSVWEMASSRNASHPGRLSVALYHRKANGDALEKEIGFEVHYDRVARSIDVRLGDPSQNPDLARGINAGTRIRDLLLKRGRLTVRQIAEELDLPEANVRTQLQRIGDATSRDGGVGGRGHEATWEVRAAPEDAPF